MSEEFENWWRKQPEIIRTVDCHRACQWAWDAATLETVDGIVREGNAAIVWQAVRRLMDQHEERIGALQIEKEDLQNEVRDLKEQQNLEHRL
jgi:hypothetical protein